MTHARIMAEPSRPHPFPATRWSIVLRSADADEATRHKALGELCEIYWPPIYAYLRGQGKSSQDAEDLKQGLFAEILARDDFARTDRSKGKLRSFLLASLKNHQINEWRRTNRQKRGGGVELIPLHSGDAETRFGPQEPADRITPDKPFLRQGLRSLLDHALGRLERRYSENGNARLFQALKPALTPGAPIDSYAELAGRLGLSESALKVAVHRLRQRFGIVLREAVADTIGPDEDADEELRHLMTAFD